MSRFHKYVVGAGRWLSHCVTLTQTLPVLERQGGPSRFSSKVMPRFVQNLFFHTHHLRSPRRAAENYMQSWCDNVTEWEISGGYEARSLVSDSGENLCAIYFWKVKGEPFIDANRTSLGEAVVAAAKQAITNDGVDPEDPHSLSSTIFDIAGAPSGGPLAAVLAANSDGTKSLAVANPEHLPLSLRHVYIDHKEEIALLALPH